MRKKITRLLSLLLVSVMLVAYFPIKPHGAYRKMCDVDNNGSVTVEDARIALRAAVGLQRLSETDILFADTDFDGEVSIDDARTILRIAVSIVSADSLTLPYYLQTTPLEYDGTSSTAKYAVINTHYSETLPSMTKPDDKSSPLCSPLLAGTYALVDGNMVSNDTYDYYNLKCGLRVYENDVSIINGYSIKNSGIRLMPVVKYGDSTDMYLKLDWRVPFNVTLTPQSYVTGYDNRPYSLKDDDFTATQMDITFYNIGKATGDLDFEKSNVIKSSKWITDYSKGTATLRLYLRNTGDFYGYDVYYNSDNYLVVSVKEKSSSLRGMTIMLEAGHGGNDAGAVSGSTYEKTINLSVAQKVKGLLEAKGATVIMVRSDDSNPSLASRRTMARNKNPDLYLCLHCDSATTSSAKGVSVFYYKNYSQPLAGALSSSLVSSYSSGGYSTTNRGALFYPFYVTRVENCPSVLIEYGFMTNSSELSFMKSSSGQDAMANGTVNGIIAYLNG